MGGIMGYRKKGSAASLASSGTFALVLLMAGCFMRNPDQAATGIRIALGTIPDLHTSACWIVVGAWCLHSTSLQSACACT